MRNRTFARALVAVAAVLAAAVPARASSQITVVRDRYGVPHVYGQTAEDVAYGAGSVLAEDRLWQMHVFRLIAKGRLSELLGPIPEVVDIDRTVRFFTYTATERAARFATYPADIRANLRAFVDGINARIAEIRSDPTLLPFEFAEFGVPLEDWSSDDTIALQDVLILAFGSGGGSELDHADLLAGLFERYPGNPADPNATANRIFNDLIVTEDPDGPITIPPGTSTPTYAREAEAQARRALTPDARIGLPPADAGERVASTLPRVPLGKGTSGQLRLIPDFAKPVRDLARARAGLRTLQRVFHFGSNAQVVGPQHSEAGNTLQTAGPQVGYLLPQWLADFGLHSADGTIDATGMTFAGAGPAVLIGRGRGYAWTTTTGASDLTDTYVEFIDSGDRRRYEYQGRLERMDCRTEVLTFRGAPFESMEICRTRHGPVFSFDEANGRAYSFRYAWFAREGQTVEGFFRYNEVRSVADFATFANYLSSNHNMFYVDDLGNYGYWHPGNHPVRASGVDLRLPQDGRGGSEWQGITTIPQAPHAVNFSRGWLSNWNNQPALGWKRERGWDAIDNSFDLQRTLDPAKPAVRDPFGGLVNPDRKLDFEDLNANLRYAAFRHHYDSYFRPLLPSDAALGTQRARDAAALVRAWDGFTTDRNGDGLYDSAGSTIVDEWVERMRAPLYGDDLGDELDRFATDDLVWHVLATTDTLGQSYGWLNGEDPAAFEARTFEAAVAALAEEFGSGDPATWKRPAQQEHYQRLNADLLHDTATGLAGLDNSGDAGLPGDVPDHIAMDRGTYNHVVVYQTPPQGSTLGNAVAQAGSVIPPGQNGFVDLAGREGPHFEDQLALYVEWRYKPMPMTLAEARALAEREYTITRP